MDRSFNLKKEKLNDGYTSNDVEYIRPLTKSNLKSENLVKHLTHDNESLTKLNSTVRLDSGLSASSSSKSEGTLHLDLNINKIAQRLKSEYSRDIVLLDDEPFYETTNNYNSNNNNYNNNDTISLNNVIPKININLSNFFTNNSKSVTLNASLNSYDINLNNLDFYHDNNTNFSYLNNTNYDSNYYLHYNNNYLYENISCIEEEDNSGWSSIYFKTAIYILYISIFLFALIGNGVVCYIVQSTPRMRTVTNYFIVNLAVGDILMSLFCIPFSFVSIFVLKYWPFGTILCQLVNYSQAVSVLVSAYTLVAISVDRYIAIMWPLRPRITKRYAKCIIAGVWLIAILTALPILLVSKLIQPDEWYRTCDMFICQEEWPSPEQNYYYTLALLTLQFVIPLSVLIFTYTRIAIAVWGKRPPGEAENSRDQRMARSKRKMIKMMVTVVVVFTICWLPFNILVLLLNDDDFLQWKPLPYFWFAFHWLAMSHSCYNPVIYCYMNARFRGGFLQVVHKIPGLRNCWCIRKCARNRSGSIGTTGFQLTGEINNKYRKNFPNDDCDGEMSGFIRKPILRIRKRRHIPTAKSKHMHNLCKFQKEAKNECDACESIFVCRNNPTSVISTSKQ